MTLPPLKNIPLMPLQKTDNEVKTMNKGVVQIKSALLKDKDAKMSEGKR